VFALRNCHIVWLVNKLRDAVTVLENISDSVDVQKVYAPCSCVNGILHFTAS
jgi:hypothetical protein